ncbi:MAG TPA: carboxymuconolactone decarboxylase family protein [Xanthobacteraceae bacterium]
MSLALAAGAGWLASGASQAPATAKEPRFPQLTLEQLNEQQRPLGEKIMKISSVGIGGPYNPLLRSPVLASRMYDLLEYLRWNSSLPPRLSELAILIQARLWRSQVEWYAHYPLALKAGLSEQVAADLKANKRPTGMKPDEEAAYDLCMDLSTKHEVSDEVFNRAKQVLGEQQVVDLIGISGTYITVAMILSAAEAGVPAGKELPFKPGEP